MHDIKWIRENTELFDKAMKARNCEAVSKKILMLDEEKRQLQTIIQKLQHARNEKAKLIAQLSAKNASSEEVKRLKKDATDIKEKLTELDNRLNSEVELEKFLAKLPNLPDSDVPIGKDEKSNIEIRKFGDIKQFDFTPQQHFEIGEKLAQMDFGQTAKISGSRFVTLFATLAKLERALANFMLDLNGSKGFIEVSPPHLVKDFAMYNTGQLPKLADDSFVTTEGYRLIPTAEVPLTNLVAGNIIDEKEFPIRYTAYSNCYRSEAGAAGRDTRGMLRQHQFSKVELVSIVKPEDSHKEHEFITNCAEEILKQLDLPYRVMLLSSGDMGFAAKKTYDLEVWMAGQKKYREISSCSNCGDFQARRMKARFKPNGQKDYQFVHTLNGSGLAIGRTIIAILENYQNADGSVTVPDVLIPYMSGIRKIE